MKFHAHNVVQIKKNPQKKMTAIKKIKLVYKRIVFFGICNILGWEMWGSYKNDLIVLYCSIKAENFKTLISRSTFIIQVLKRSLSIFSNFLKRIKFFSIKCLHSISWKSSEYVNLVVPWQSTACKWLYSCMTNYWNNNSKY